MALVALVMEWWQFQPDLVCGRDAPFSAYIGALYVPIMEYLWFC